MARSPLAPWLLRRLRGHKMARKKPPRKTPSRMFRSPGEAIAEAAPL
jgi:hypothetical protein